MTLEVSICSDCGGAFAARLSTCYGCATAAAAAHAGEGWPEVPDAGAEEGDARRPVLSVRDFAALERLARLRLRPDDPISAALLRKLDRCRVVRADAIGADVATLGSRVVFSADGGPPEARVLVLPTRTSAAGWTLPVTTPRGLALLGHAVGAVVPVAGEDGSVGETLHLLSVAYQPEAAEAAAAMVRGGGAGDAGPSGAIAAHEVQANRRGLA